jgi:hypothetical protein
MARLTTPAAAASLLVLTATLFAPAHAQQRTEVGTAASVVGEVRMSNTQIRDPRRITARQRLAWGDMVQTGGGSQLQILLLDRSTFGIGARSRVTIDRYVYDPAQGRSLAATFLRGALRFFSGRQAPGNSADVTTPSGRIGIRGTAIDMLVGEEARAIARDEAAVGDIRSREDEATLVVLRGPGAGTAGGLTPGLAEVTAAGVTVQLDNPGEAAFIPFNGAPPIGPFQISDAGLSRVIDRLAGEVVRAGDGGLLGDLLPVAAGVAAVAVGVLVATDDDSGQTATTQDTTGQNPAGQTTAPNTTVPTTGATGVPPSPTQVN